MPDLPYQFLFFLRRLIQDCTNTPGHAHVDISPGILARYMKKAADIVPD
jgi:hypothetical protein